MVNYRIKFTKDARNDAKKLKSSHLADKTKNIIEIIKTNPYQNPPAYEKLVGNLKGLYSRRINIQHRLVYEVIESQKIIKIVSMWNHY